MLMMRLQRVGRRNDPSYRIVVTDKRTGPKSDKHVARLGSYNPKMNHVQINAAAAKDWISKGVQPSDTVYNILVGEKIVEGRKKNVLPKKSPIIDEEALAKAKEEAEAKAAAEAEAKVAEEAAAAEATEETPEKPATEEAAPEASEDTVAEPAAEETEEDKKEG